MLKKFSALVKSKNDSPVIIVSGLPRSGTSLMMQILVAGGLEAMIDHIRSADDDNPRGYYEFERVKKLQDGDAEWLNQAHGKVVKIISALLPCLPPDHHYKIIFMRRNLGEILASQKKMLSNRGENPDEISDEEMGKLFMKHLQTVEDWIGKQKNVRRMDIDYNVLVQDPFPVIEQINHFFDDTLDQEKMVQAVDPSLYRKRVNSSTGK